MSNKAKDKKGTVNITDRTAKQQLEKKKKLEKALRENLKRRKAQN